MVLMIVDGKESLHWHGAMRTDPSPSLYLSGAMVCLELSILEGWSFRPTLHKSTEFESSFSLTSRFWNGIFTMLLTFCKNHWNWANHGKHRLLDIHWTYMHDIVSTRANIRHKNPQDISKPDGFMALVFQSLPIYHAFSISNKYRFRLQTHQSSIITNHLTKKKRTRSLVGGWPTPRKNTSSSVGMMTFPTGWEVIKFHGSKSPPSSGW